MLTLPDIGTPGAEPKHIPALPKRSTSRELASL
jgi:hypothetical protein